MTDKVTVALKRKFAGKLFWKEKTGELTLAYDFAAKHQLSDFEVGEKRVLVAKKALGVEAGDELRHLAKFKTLTVSVVMGLKSMNEAGVGSSNGAWFTTGGTGHDAITAISPEGPLNYKVVPERFRKGNIPVVFNVTSQKISAKYAGEVITVPTSRANDVHQLVLRGGADGCSFAGLVITGIPDPKWLQEMTEGE